MKIQLIAMVMILTVWSAYGQSIPGYDSLNPPLAPNMDEFIVRDGETFFRLYRDSKITINKNMAGGYVHIDKGSNIVFQWYDRAVDWDGVSDDNHTEEAYFEFNPNLEKQSFTADSLRSIKAFYSWGCFCDWPDSNQVEIKNGYVKLDHLPDSSWKINLSFISDLKQKTINIDTVLSYFKGGYSLANSDTINRLDFRGKRIGYWEEKTKFENKYGYYLNDEGFTGVEMEYGYLKKNKVLMKISYYEMNTESKRIRFNNHGRVIEHCELVDKKDWICKDEKQ